MGHHQLNVLSGLFSLHDTFHIDWKHLSHQSLKLCMYVCTHTQASVVEVQTFLNSCTESVYSSVSPETVASGGSHAHTLEPVLACVSTSEHALPSAHRWDDLRSCYQSGSC
jgi:hypothetical protein